MDGRQQDPLGKPHISDQGYLLCSACGGAYLQATAATQDSVAIEYWCEGCDTAPAMEIKTVKGNRHVSWRELVNQWQKA